jgi:hypothetical protein
VKVLKVQGVTNIYGQIDWPSTVEFIRVLGVDGVTYIY